MLSWDDDPAPLRAHYNSDMAFRIAARRFAERAESPSSSPLALLCELVARLEAQHAGDGVQLRLPLRRASIEDAKRQRLADAGNLIDRDGTASDRVLNRSQGRIRQ